MDQNKAGRLAYRDRGVDPLYVGLLHEDLPGLGAQRLHLRLLDGLAPPEQLDLAVEVAVVHRVRPSRSRSANTTQGTTEEKSAVERLARRDLLEGLFAVN